MRAVIVSTCLACVTIFGADQSVFHLKDGRTITGKKLGELAGRVMIKQADGERAIIDWKDIARVEEGADVREGPTKEAACVYLGEPHSAKWLKKQYGKFCDRIHLSRGRFVDHGMAIAQAEADKKTRTLLGSRMYITSRAPSYTALTREEFIDALATGLRLVDYRVVRKRHVTKKEYWTSGGTTRKGITGAFKVTRKPKRKTKSDVSYTYEVASEPVPTSPMRGDYQKQVDSLVKASEARCLDRKYADRPGYVKFEGEWMTQSKQRTIEASRRSSPPSSRPTRRRSGGPKQCGTGFVVTADGHILTNSHVVDGARRLAVKTEGALLQAALVASDPGNDIAILKVDGVFTPVEFASDRIARLGQTVFTVGFPMPSVQGFSPKVTKGVVSSLKGIQDDPRMYQIDAAIQPGNSGGALADEAGNIIGLVTARINDAMVMRGAGVVPQNVNYAVKKSYALAVLDSYPEISAKVRVAAAAKVIPFEEAVEKLRKSTVLVAAY